MDISRINLAVAPIKPSQPFAPADATGVAVKPAPVIGKPPGAAFSTDNVHLSVGNRTNGMPASTLRFADPDPKQEFGSAVHVEKARDPSEKRLFGLLPLTANQNQQIRAAESRAFDRFYTAGNDVSRGSLQAKMAQASLNTYMPGLLEHNTPANVTNDEKSQIMHALQDYGEELGSIGITGRSRRDLDRYLEDKFFITLFDRDTEDFEDYFKNGAHNFFGDSFGNNTPDNNVVKPSQPASGDKTPVNLPPQTPQEQYKWKFFQPRLGVSLKGTDFKEAMIRPKVDLVKLRGPADTEVRLVADVAFNMNGKLEPKGQIYARRMLNAKPGEYGGLTDNIWAESQTEYIHEENKVNTSLGVRKQISPDSSMGFYALYSAGTNSVTPNDLGLGVNYQARWN